MREYVERWQRVGPLLEKMRRDELRNFDHAANATRIDQLLAAGLLHARPRTTSGLVEMQRIFARARQ